MTLLLTAGLLCFWGGVTFETMSSLGGNQLTDETKTAIRKAWGDRSDDLGL